MAFAAVDMDAVARGVADHSNTLATTAALSVVAYWLSIRAIPRVMNVLFDRGLYGIDINKNSMATRKRFGELKRGGSANQAELRKLAVPESLGIVVGGIFLCIVAIVLVLSGAVAALDGQELPLTKANAALNCIALMLLLGFVDDVLEVPWRYKIILSIVGVVPLLLAYDGPLTILVPGPLVPYLPAGLAPLVHLGPLYLVYMALFCVFCTNSINILAGVNGVEVGQSIVIGVASILYNIVQLRIEGSQPQHVLCLVLLVPFVAVSLALWKFNKYPSRVFVGDSYTYFAGITLAVAGITGAYTKTLMLFFLPQLINFVLSLPQLFHIVPCPRHRVPDWVQAKDVLTNSRNLTILNAFLLVFGDMHERTLTAVTIGFQVLCCAAAFWIRYGLAALVYDVVV